MEQPTQVNLTSFSFDELVAFLFDRDLPPESQERDPWYWNVEVEEFDAKGFALIFHGIYSLIES